MMDALKFTGKVIKKRPLRSILTILQLALGVWIVAIMLSFSLHTATEDNLARNLEETLAQVRVSQEITGNGMGYTSFASNFRARDLNRLLDESIHIESAFFYSTYWSVTVRAAGKSYIVRTLAETTPDLVDGIGLEIVAGEFFSQADIDQNNQVAVISETISNQLFPNHSPVGQQIEIGVSNSGDANFTIIGVYKPPTSALGYFLQESFVMVPLGYRNQFYMSMDREILYNEIYIKSAPRSIYAAVEDAKLIFADRATGSMEINAQYFAEVRSMMQSGQQSMTLFLGSFAFVAIVISSIGILSIMLVSVVERTREIGLRRALGASRGEIIGQILNESFVFSVLGALVGLVVASFTTEYVSEPLLQQVFMFGDRSFIGLHPLAIVYALILAVGVGQLLGLYPAFQAAKLPPVEALRGTW